VKGGGDMADAKEKKGVTSVKKKLPPVRFVPYNEERKFMSKADAIADKRRLDEKRAFLKEKDKEFDAEAKTKRARAEAEADAKTAPAPEPKPKPKAKKKKSKTK